MIIFKSCPFWLAHHDTKTQYLHTYCNLSEFKKARQEIKKKSSDTLKLQKKAKKGIYVPNLHKFIRDQFDWCIETTGVLPYVLTYICFAPVTL